MAFWRVGFRVHGTGRGDYDVRFWVCDVLDQSHGESEGNDHGN